MKKRIMLLAAALAAFHFSSAAWASHGAIVISNDPTQNMSCASGVCTPTDHNVVLNVTDLENMLAASDVTVSTKFVVGKHLKYVREIDLTVPLNWSASSKLTLGSDNNPYVAIKASVSVLGARPGGFDIAKPLRNVLE